MKSLLLAALAAAAALLLTSCAGSTNVREMSNGERLFRANCNSCHVLPKPEKHADEAWPALVSRYGTIAKLDSLKRAEIIEYLQSAN